MGARELVTFRLDPFIVDKLEKEAGERGWNMSTMYRHIIKSWLEQYHEPRERVIQMDDGKQVKITYRLKIGGDDLDVIDVEIT